MPTKKQRERWLLDRFGQLSSQLPAVPPIDSENPDFLFEASLGVLGIEVREVFELTAEERRPRQEGEREAERIIAEAQGRCEQAGVPPLNVLVSFNNKHELRKKVRRHLVDAIVQAVSQNVPTAGVPVRLRNDWRLESLPAEIHAIHIYLIPTAKQHVWDAPDAGFFQEDCISILQQAINEKAGKLDRYLEKCQTCWLLLATDGMRPSSFLTPDHNTRDHNFDTPFSRTFFVNSIEDDWFELRGGKPAV